MSQLQVTGEAKVRDIQGPVVANSGVITALDGDASQYVRGDGTLADFPTSTGGGSSVSYYLNSSVSQGTIGGVAYRQLSKTPISGAGTDITISANGYVASYITDANDPALLEVPAGNFNCEFYFSVNSNNHNPYVYAELYKYDGTTFTLLGSNQAIPEYLTNGTTLSAYYFAIPVSFAALTITDRLAIRIYVNVDGRTVTLHTENNHLCQVVTTFSKGLTTLNNLTRQVQFLGTGTSGTDFNISSVTATHTFNLPVASAANTGKLSSTDWSTFNGKVPYTGANANVNLGTNSLTATGVTIAKSSGISSLIFPIGGNDPAFIQHEESTTDTGIMRFSVGDNNDATDYFVFGNTSGASNAYVERFKITSSGIVNLGTWQGTAIADSYIASAATWNAKQNAITLTTTGTSGAATFVGATLNIPQYQGLLTNPVTGTGTTNNLPKFTGASTIGDSAITDDGTTVTLVSRALSGVSALFSSSITSNLSLTVNRFSNGDYLALKIENRPITAGNNGVGIIAFFSNKADATTDTYTSGKIYGKFDSDSYNAARITLSTVTGNNIYQDVLTAKDTNVGIGTINPAQTLDLYTTSATATGVGTAIQIQSAGTGANQGWVGVNKGTGNGLTFSVQNNSIIFNTDASTKFGGTEKFRISTDNSSFTHPLSIITNDNNFAFNVQLRNNNTGTQALTGLGISDSSNTRKGQVLWIPSNYITASLQNSFLVSSVTNIPLILCADATGADTPNIIFQSGATNKMLLNGATGNFSIGNTNNDYKLDVTGTGRFSSTVYMGGTVGFISDAALVAQINTPVSSDRYFAVNNNGAYGLVMGYSTTSGTARIANISNSPMTLSTNNIVALTLAANQAATFSSSIAATSAIFSSSISATNGSFSGVVVAKTELTGTNNGFLTYDASGYGAGMGYVAGSYGFITSIGSTSPLVLAINNTERLRITTAGNVGIGTSSPAAKLEVVPENVNGNEGIFVNQLGSRQSTIRFKSAHSANSDYRIGASILVDSAFEIYSVNAAATRMLITSGGNVGIGTSSPNNTANYSTLSINGTSGGQITWQTGGNLVGYAYNTASSVVLGANTGNFLAFDAGATERMRITSGGRLTIGSTTALGKLNSFSTEFALPAIWCSSNWSGDTGYTAMRIDKFDNNSTTSQVFINFSVANNSTANGQINANGSGAVAFGSWSDKRLKENIVDLEPQLNNILSLRPVEFDYIESEGGGHQTGFIAQEIQEVYPDAVGERQDGMLTVTGWSKTEARLVKAIQELEARIKQLENK